MADVNSEKIVIKLDSTEAIDVGWAIKEKLLKTVREGYDINENYPTMYNLCKQLLTVAYSYDYGPHLDSALKQATPEDKEENI